MHSATTWYFFSLRLINFKAQSIAPDGSTVEVGKGDFFDEKVNRYWRQRRFAMPNVQEGSVIEYYYEVTSGNFFTLNKWYFQDFIPTRWSELRFSMVDWLQYNTVMLGTIAPVINEQKSSSENFNGTSVPVNAKRWALQDVPAMQREPFTACRNDYRSRMQFQLLSVEIPGNFTEKYEWPRIMKILLDSDSFGRQYLKKGASKKLVEAAAPVVDAAPTPLDKAKAIYGFVNANMKWNGIHYYDSDDELDKMLAKGTGYSGDLNLMVLALLRANDITAYPVLTSTRSNGKVNPFYPLVSQFDHVLVWAEIDGAVYYIDAGDPLLPFGMPSEEALNLEGLFLNDKKNTFDWVKIEPPKATSVMLVNATPAEDGSIRADISTSHNGYSGLSERTACKDKEAKTHWQGRLAQRYPDVALEQFELQGLALPEQSLKGKMQATIPDAVMVSGDLMYVSPMLYSEYSENPFKAETRTLPIEYAYPFQEQVILNLDIPEGFLVDGLPESVLFSLPDDAASFSYRVNEVDGKVQVISKLEMKQTFFLPESYASLRNFFSLIEQKQGEQVVLKKQT